MTTETTVNGLWLFAITSEMVLNFRTGLINRNGSPFAQFRKVFPDAPKNKKECLVWVHNMYIENKIERIPKNLLTFIEEQKK